MAEDAYRKLRPWKDIEACACASVPSLLLVDTLTDNPLHCGACRKEVDPARLALSAEEVQAVVEWFRPAHALYELWLASGEYEAYAKAKLTDPTGEVSRLGLKAAALLSDRLPTRLWMFRDPDDGFPAACPRCGGDLDEDVQWGFGCCEACRLQL